MDGIAAAAETKPPRRDWRLWLGLGLTLLWLLLGIVYVGSVVGFGAFLEQGAEAIGGFLEGGFAPLAFLWLVIGFFLQQRELSENTRAIRMQYLEMRRTAEQAEIQARAIQANELHARQDTFIEIAAMVQRQLGATAGLLYVSIVGQDGSRSVAQETLSEMWGRTVSDHELFSRSLLGLHFAERTEGRSSRDIFLATPVRCEHVNRFIEIFSRLLTVARQCDPDGMICEAILGGANGLLYQVLREHRDGIPAPTWSAR